MDFVMSVKFISFLNLVICFDFSHSRPEPLGNMVRELETKKGPGITQGKLVGKVEGLGQRLPEKSLL